MLLAILIFTSTAEPAAAQLGASPWEVQQRYGVPLRDNPDPIEPATETLKFHTWLVTQTAFTLGGQPARIPAANVIFGFIENRARYAVLEMDALLGSGARLTDKGMQDFMAQVTMPPGRRRRRRFKWRADPSQSAVYPQLGQIANRFKAMGSIGRWFATKSTIDSAGRVLEQSTTSWPIRREIPYRAGVGVSKVVLVSGDNKLYTTLILDFDSDDAPNGRVREIVTCGAELYWQWTFDSLLEQLHKQPIAPPASKSIIELSYEEAFAAVVPESQRQQLLKQRLLAAVIIAVENEHVPLASLEQPITRTTKFAKYAFQKSLVFRLRRKYPPKTQQRSATLLGQVGDEQAVTPLIGLLNSKGATPQIAAEALRQIVQRDPTIPVEDFGTDADQWRQWWAEHRKRH